MTDPARLVAALRRDNFYFFVKKVFRELHGGAELGEAPYLEAMCFALQRAAQQDGGRLLVTIPPRHLKSIAASVALPAWIMGRSPSTKVMVATYGEESPARTSKRSDQQSALYRGRLICFTPIKTPGAVRALLLNPSARHLTKS